MRLYVQGSHALGVHGHNLLLNVLSDANLILPQYLGFQFPLPIPGSPHVHLAETGSQPLAALPVAAVVYVLVFVNVPAVPNSSSSSASKPFSMNSAIVFLNSSWMSSMLPIFASCSNSRIFSRRTFFSGVRSFLAIVKTSNVLPLFYTTSELYTNLGIGSVSQRETPPSCCSVPICNM